MYILYKSSENLSLFKSPGIRVLPLMHNFVWLHVYKDTIDVSSITGVLIDEIT